MDDIMDEHSIEAVFSKAVAETYQQFLEAFNLLDEQTAPTSAGASESSPRNTMRTGLVA